MKNQNNKVFKSIYIDKQTDARIAKLAKADKRSYSQYVVNVLIAHTKQHLETEAQATNN